MYRLIIKASNVRQAAASIEANTLLHTVQRMERLRDTHEWIADLVGMPQDRGVMDTLNKWFIAGKHKPPEAGYGFPDGTLLYWTWVDSTLIHANVDAENHLTEALSAPMPS